jgi:TonB family protein
MKHGIEGYFLERARFERRVSLTTMVFSASLFGALLLTQIAFVRERIDPLLRRTVRFGYEGPDQYVERITLQRFGGQGPMLRDVGRVEPKVMRKGGAEAGRHSRDPHAEPETQPQLQGTGFADRDMMARAVSRLSNVPVVQSEELVILASAMPVYPQPELDHNIEGRVVVQALVDTTGNVVEVQVVQSTGELSFEQSVQTAVWQYRFRPYLRSGMTSEVYAVFRFSFRIY